ncbi:MAG: hypothetical protein AAF515_21520 [Pseudomonadota bacterium]
MIKRQTLGAALCALALAAIAGCAAKGTRLIEKPVAFEPPAPLITAADDHLSVTLDWVIVRDGPGSWAERVDWDEYLLRVDNLGSEPVILHAMQVVDSLGVAQASAAERVPLVLATKRNLRRYRREDIRVQAGIGGSGMLGASVAVAGAGIGIASAAASASTLGAALGTATMGAAVVLAAPVVAIGGLRNVVREGRVDQRIGERATPLPLTVAPGATNPVDLFYPLTPGVQRIELSYSLGSDAPDAQPRALSIDTRQALGFLHLPDFRPPEAAAPAGRQVGGSESGGAE